VFIVCQKHDLCSSNHLLGPIPDQSLHSLAISAADRNSFDFPHLPRFANLSLFVNRQSAALHTPTSASWLNMVERFFAEITRNRIRRGAFKSVAELKNAIMQYLEKRNAKPKPFVDHGPLKKSSKKSPERNKR
jgi:hypothetical protein